jgi:hypothetical protein
MNLLDDVPVGAVVGLDTDPLIYFLEGHASYGPVVLPFFDTRLQHGLNEAITSVVSLAEVLVKLLSAARHDLAQRYRDLLTGAPPTLPWPILGRGPPSGPRICGRGTAFACPILAR